MKTITTDLELDITLNGKTDEIFIDVDYHENENQVGDPDYSPSQKKIIIDEVRYGNEDISFILSPVHYEEMIKQILENK